MWADRDLAYESRRAQEPSSRAVARPERRPIDGPTATAAVIGWLIVIAVLASMAGCAYVLASLGHVSREDRGDFSCASARGCEPSWQLPAGSAAPAGPPPGDRSPGIR